MLEVRSFFIVCEPRLGLTSLRLPNEHHLLPDKYGGEDQNDEKKDHSTDEAKDQSIESRTLTVQFALLAAVLVEVIIVTLTYRAIGRIVAVSTVIAVGGVIEARPGTEAGRVVTCDFVPGVAQTTIHIFLQLVDLCYSCWSSGQIAQRGTGVHRLADVWQ